MAPSAADPRQILVICNDARRSAFYSLVESITSSMRSELELESLRRDSKPKENDAPKDPDQTGEGISESFAGRKKSNSSPTDGLPRELVEIRKAALKHFDDWRKEVLKKLKEVTSTHDDKKILEARKKRQEEVAKMREQPGPGDEPTVFGTTENSATHNATDVAILQQHYRPVSTRFTTVPIEDKRELLSCMLLIMLSTGNYSAYSRTLALHLTSSLELPLAVLITEETEIAKYLVEASTAKGEDGTEAKKAAAASTMSADAEAEKRRKENQTSRFWKVGLASVAGAAVIGVTGGLAAPIVAGALGGIMGSVGLGGVASFLGIFWANGALVGTLFGAYGAKMTGEMMDAYAKEVNDFKFIPLKGPKPTDKKQDSPADKQTRRLRVTIGVNGWLKDEEDVTKPWEVLGDESEVFALRYEMKALIELGNCLDSLVSDYAWKYVKSEILKRTVLASVQAIMWPVYLLKTASNIDNPFNLARNRSEKTGRVLADALINRAQGERPVTLIGYSLGARAIHSCLRTLAERQAFGLVDNVVLIGAPTPSATEHWAILRSVVAGRIFNVYSENDYILGFLYRATSLQFGIAGLQPVKGVPGLENLDLSDEVAGHLRYPGLISQILTRCGFPDVKGDSGDIEQDEDIVRKQRGELDNDEVPDEARAIKEEDQKPMQMDDDNHEPILMYTTYEHEDEGPPPPLPKRRPMAD